MAKRLTASAAIFGAVALAAVLCSCTAGNGLESAPRQEVEAFKTVSDKPLLTEEQKAEALETGTLAFSDASGMHYVYSLGKDEQGNLIIHDELKPYF